MKDYCALSNIKSQCKTAKQRKAFNHLVKTFAGSNLDIQYYLVKYTDQSGHYITLNSEFDQIVERFNINGDTVIRGNGGSKTELLSGPFSLLEAVNELKKVRSDRNVE